MEAFRQWWANVIKAALSGLASLWQKLVHGVTQSWDIELFILGMGVVLILAATVLWRRRA